MTKPPPDMDQISRNLKRTIIKIFSDRKLINILVVIAVLVGVYYLISPYQDCKREMMKEGKSDYTVMSLCAKRTSW